MKYRYYTDISGKGIWRSKGKKVYHYYPTFFNGINHLWVREGLTFKEVTDKQRFKRVSEEDIMLELL